MPLPPMTEPAVPLPERPGIMPVKEREGERERGREAQGAEESGGETVEQQ